MESLTALIAFFVIILLVFAGAVYLEALCEAQRLAYLYLRFIKGKQKP